VRVLHSMSSASPAGDTALTQAGLDDAQRELLRGLTALEQAGERVVGWKLGLTSGSNRDAFGVGIRPFGYLLASRVLRSGSSIWWDEAVRVGSIENELCFQLSQDISQAVDAQTVREHLAGVAPSFEINQARLAEGANSASRVADNLSNWGLVTGALVPLPDSWDQAAVKVSQLHNADGVSSTVGAGHIDDHFESIAVLANQLLRFGRRLEAGHWVITGAFTRAQQPAAGLWSGDFGAFGRVHLRIER